jgi:hypothetical protein
MAPALLATFSVRLKNKYLLRLTEESREPAFLMAMSELSEQPQSHLQYIGRTPSMARKHQETREPLYLLPRHTFIHPCALPRRRFIL